MRRREHDQWHDWKVAAAAIGTLALIWLISELTDYDPPAPVPPAAEQPGPSDRRTAAQLSASRSDQRTAPSPSVRGGAPSTPATSSERGSKGDVAGFTATQRCIRNAESGGNYRAENPTSSASGAWQFIDSTWESVTGLPAPASSYPRQVQDAAFRKLWAGGAGAGHWVTASRCGA